MSERNPISAKFSKFCFEVLDHYNIKYEKVDLYGVSTVNFNNFYIRKYRVIDKDASNNVLKYFMPFIKDKDVKPFRKTFVSRRLATVVKQKHYGDALGSRLSRNTYQRLDEEKQLEDFFASQGFEVICPEDFDSFEDQVNYFYEVKTIVSITGGGLTNMIFMQNGGNVIELMSTLITNQSMGTKTPNGLEEGQHHFYHSIAFRKNFTYFGIPNIDAKCDTLVERIEKDGILKMLEGR
jgi:hypothetical protein